MGRGERRGVTSGEGGEEGSDKWRGEERRDKVCNTKAA